MQLVKLITPKRIKTLHCLPAGRQGFSLAFLVLLMSAFQPAFSQDNSPYSRFGIGDLVPSSHIMSRGMGGISSAYTDPYSINFANPAAYSSFQGVRELKSKKLISGRAILDVGLNFENRTLKEPGTTKPKFTASNALFSYIQVGVPLKQNWGLSFGLRPVSRISYNIIWNGRIADAGNGSPIDSGSIRNTGTGGAYLASVGTGFAVYTKKKMINNIETETEKLSFGINGGYYFGSKDYSTRVRLLNDTVEYKDGNYETKTNFGSLYFNAGMQYQVRYKQNTRMFTIAAAGNWGQKINATRDRIVETYIFDENSGNLRLDSVSDTRNVKGKIYIPSSITVGFILQKYAVPNKSGGFIFGMDFVQQSWSKYRYYGETDSVMNNWQIKVGAQINPIPKPRNYFSNVAYRFGFFIGPDYIKVQKKLPQVGGSFGLGLPVRSNQQVPQAVTLINLAFEYGKRGNNDNLLKETMFRFSLGFSLSDMWFVKRKYD